MDIMSVLYPGNKDRIHMESNAAASDYPTCECCFTTLYIETGDVDPNRVSEILNLQPTSIQIRGEARANMFSRRINPLNGWSFSSEGFVESKDLRKHLDWLFDNLSDRKTEIECLRQLGCDLRVSCYWLSKAGHGGPTLSKSQIKSLAEFEFDICLDIYFVEETVSGECLTS